MPQIEDIQNFKDIIVPAIFGICLAIVFVGKALYVTPIENVFMSERKRMTYDMFMVLMIWGLFAFADGVVVFLMPRRNGIILLLGLGSLIFFGIRYAVYFFILRKAKKCKEDIEKLINHYIEKQVESLWMMWIVEIMVLLYVYDINKYKMNLAIYISVASLLQVIVISLFNPCEVKKKYLYYIIDQGQKYYIYKAISKQEYLCGDTIEQENKTGYRVIEKNKLKEGKIERESYCTSFDEDKIKYKKYLDKQREEKKGKK